MMYTASSADLRTDKTDSIIFRNKEHEEFYHTILSKCQCRDVYHKALAYCLGIDRDIREHIDRIYDFTHGYIKPKCLREGWQTSGSTRTVRLAFNLYCNDEPSRTLCKTKQEKLEESRLYDVEEIFCCGYAPYFVQAVKIRYPEYFTEE